VHAHVIKKSIDKLPNKQMYADSKIDPNIEIFESEEQENDNIIITSPIQSINNTNEDEQVCIYDYLNYSERCL
jgi:hypothetical protein